MAANIRIYSCGLTNLVSVILISRNIYEGDLAVETIYKIVKVDNNFLDPWFVQPLIVISTITCMHTNVKTPLLHFKCMCYFVPIHCSLHQYC